MIYLTVQCDHCTAKHEAESAKQKGWQLRYEIKQHCGWKQYLRNGTTESPCGPVDLCPKCQPKKAKPLPPCTATSRSYRQPWRERRKT